MRQDTPVRLYASGDGTLSMRWNDSATAQGNRITLEQACDAARVFCDGTRKGGHFKVAQVIQQGEGAFHLAPRVERLDETHLQMAGKVYELKKAEKPSAHSPYEFLTTHFSTGELAVADHAGHVAALNYFLNNERLFESAPIIDGAPELDLTQRESLIDAMVEKLDTTVLTNWAKTGCTGLRNETPRALITQAIELGVAPRDYGITDLRFLDTGGVDVVFSPEQTEASDDYRDLDVYVSDNGAQWLFRVYKDLESGDVIIDDPRFAPNRDADFGDGNAILPPVHVVAAVYGVLDQVTAILEVDALSSPKP